MGSITTTSIHKSSRRREGEKKSCSAPLHQYHRRFPSGTARWMMSSFSTRKKCLSVGLEWHHRQRKKEHHEPLSRGKEGKGRKDGRGTRISPRRQLYTLLHDAYNGGNAGGKTSSGCASYASSHSVFPTLVIFHFAIACRGYKIPLWLGGSPPRGDGDDDDDASSSSSSVGNRSCCHHPGAMDGLASPLYDHDARKRAVTASVEAGAETGEWGGSREGKNDRHTHWVYCQ